MRYLGIFMRRLRQHDRYGLQSSGWLAGGKSAQASIDNRIIGYELFLGYALPLRIARHECDIRDRTRRRESNDFAAQEGWRNRDWNRLPPASDESGLRRRLRKAPRAGGIRLRGAP